MSQKPDEPTSATQSTPSEPTPAPQKHEQDEAWRPRIDSSQRVLHGFRNYNQEGDPLTQSPNITDPNEDSAPLQGSMDRSDEDSVVTGNYSDSEEDAAARQAQARARQAGTDSERNAQRSGARGPKKGG